MKGLLRNIQNDLGLLGSITILLAAILDHLNSFCHLKLFVLRFYLKSPTIPWLRKDIVIGAWVKFPFQTSLWLFSFCEKRHHSLPCLRFIFRMAQKYFCFLVWSFRADTVYLYLSGWKKSLFFWQLWIQCWENTRQSIERFCHLTNLFYLGEEDIFCHLTNLSI